MIQSNADTSWMRALPLTLAATATLALAACDQPEDIQPEPQQSVAPSPQPAVSPVSILRETPEPEIDDKVPTDPFEIVVPFAEGGSKLDAAAREVIDMIVASEQFRLGGAIVLRGHTDSIGSDDANLKASRKRAEAVAEVLEENGATPSRIEITPLGEMRQIAPNAHLDGTPDEEGRAKNRRVEVTVAPPEPEPISNDADRKAPDMDPDLPVTAGDRG